MSIGIKVELRGTPVLERLIDVHELHMALDGFNLLDSLLRVPSSGD